MLIVWKKPTKTELEKATEDCISQAEDFFNKNPKRKICKVRWHASLVKIRRNHVRNDVEAHAKTVETV